MREKLIEVLKTAPFEGQILDYWWFEEKIARFADYLIANGVTIKVGSCKGCKWENRKRPQRCNCCRRNKDMQDGYTPEQPKEET